MKLRKISMIVCMMLCICSINVSASNETSKYFVTYENEVEKDSKEDCEVYISIPYTYSEEIPKISVQEDVQTGDNTNIMGWVLVGVSSLIGMKTLIFKKKEK